ncbi:MAG: hypothetical protein KDD38_00115 [Bdellovibrionales bacterium]|nr:hypothetical protein [Bdellovibrionales bacterium]
MVLNVDSSAAHDREQKSAIFFLALIFLPTIFFLLSYAGDNRRLDLHDYFQDHFKLSKTLYKLNTTLQVQLLKSKNIGKVHLGKDNWLFFINQVKVKENSWDDLWSIPTPTVAAFWSEYLEKSFSKPFGFNAKYLFVVVPNKETVYRERTHYNFKEFRFADQGNYGHIQRTVRSINPEASIDLIPTLIEHGQDLPTYHPADSHWNHWGAYWAHIEILKKVNQLLGSNIEPLPINSPRIEWNAQHDMFDIIKERGLTSIVPLAAIMNKNIHVDFVYDCCDEAIKSREDNYHVFENPQAQYVVWLIGDSYMNYLRKYIPTYFKKTVVITHSQITSEDIQNAYRETGPPDLIIEERSERGLSTKLSYSDYSPKN